MKEGKTAETAEKNKNTRTGDGGVKSSTKDAEEKIIDLSNDTRLKKQVEGVYGADRYKIIMNYILDELGGQPVTLSDGISAYVDKRDAMHISHKAYSRKTAEIAKVKELVEKAKYFAYEKSTKDNKFSLFRYYKAKVLFGNDIFDVYLNVGLTRNDKTYHIYDITEKLRDSAHLIDVGRLTKSIAQKNAVSNDSIPNPTKEVNNNFSTSIASDTEYMELAKEPEKNKAKLQNMVEQAAKAAGYSQRMYHGSKKTADIKVFRDWQYFTENKKYAERYAGQKLYEVFVKANKWFDTRSGEDAAVFDEARQEYGLGEIGDRNVITAKDVPTMRKQITSFFNQLLDNQKSIDITTFDGEILTLTKKETADKARDNNKTVNDKSSRMRDDEFALKLRVESHIDEIAESSKPQKHNGERKDTKNHSFARDNFVYRTAYFRDYDGSYYRIKLSTGIRDNMVTVYNVGKINEDKLPAAKIIAVVGSKPLGNLSYKDSIRNNFENVNNNFSRMDSDSDYSGNGYSGYSMSNNAVAAYNAGEMPLSKWRKEDIINAVREISEEKADMLTKVGKAALVSHLLQYRAWHHTSSMYNKTDFYGINEDAVENMTMDDVREWEKEKASKPPVKSYKGSIKYCKNIKRKI